MTFRNRVSLLLASTALLMATGAHAVTLAVGDQRGNARAVLDAAGALQGAPYQVEWHEFPNAAPLLEALIAAHLDAGMVGDAPLTFAAAAGAQVKGIFATRYLGNAVIVGATSNVKSIADLKGRRIATVKGSSGYAMTVTALQRAGLSSRDVQWVFLAPSEATLALTNGDVDAVASWEPYVSYAVQQGGARIVVDGRDFPSLNYLVASPTAIQEKRAALADFAARLQRARVWGTQHPDAYAKVIAKQLGLPEAVALGKVRREANVPESDVKTVLATQQATIDLYHDTGLTPKAFPATDVVDTRFFTGGAKP